MSRYYVIIPRNDPDFGPTNSQFCTIFHIVRKMDRVKNVGKNVNFKNVHQEKKFRQNKIFSTTLHICDTPSRRYAPVHRAHCRDGVSQIWSVWKFFLFCRISILNFLSMIKNSYQKTVRVDKIDSKKIVVPRFDDPARPTHSRINQQ